MMRWLTLTLTQEGAALMSARHTIQPLSRCKAAALISLAKRYPAVKKIAKVGNGAGQARQVILCDGITMPKPLSHDWINLRRDPDTGIESVHAHFYGHAYDPHDHDEMLVGVTQTGLQRFNCRRRLHTSTPGRVILIEPGAVHDGHAPDAQGFAYTMLYLPQAWMTTLLQRRGLGDISTLQTAFRHTLTDDVLLQNAIQNAFHAVHDGEGKLARDQTLDRLIDLLARHLTPDSAPQASPAFSLMWRVRDYMHDDMAQDMGLDELARYAGIDRFRLTRQFQKVFGQSPHAYLVQLRLRTARGLLARGVHPAQAAVQVGFADQSHLGRWFRRAYRITPAGYQHQCTNVLYRRR